ncbi:hypothetical protein [Pseudomonas peli]|uniref:hypothetical protein n=1 Tax=Pseudomonas peli TaxID=592361 RepID=UPI0024AD941B|nr:hypothetical protein [Pseudomonas peli]
MAIALNQGTRALVGDGAQITAQRIGLGAQYIQPLNLGGFDRWSSLSDIGKNMLSLCGWPNDLAVSFPPSTPTPRAPPTNWRSPVPSRC